MADAGMDPYDIQMEDGNAGFMGMDEMEAINEEDEDMIVNCGGGAPEQF